MISKPEASHLQPYFSELLVKLYYPSESDEPIEYIELPNSVASPLSISQIRSFLNLQPNIAVKEISEKKFWEPAITVENWFGEEEKAQIHRFLQLKAEICRQLTSRRAFRVGSNNVALYLLGRKQDGNWAGLKTLLIET